jgi:hypothetical protein
MAAETMIQCEGLTKRLNEPPEPSPGLSDMPRRSEAKTGAMPWVNVPQIIPRPEGAQEPLEKFNRVLARLEHSSSGRFSRPFRAGRSICVSIPRHRAGALSLGLYSHGLSDHHHGDG